MQATPLILGFLPLCKTLTAYLTTSDTLQAIRQLYQAE